MKIAGNAEIEEDSGENEEEEEYSEDEDEKNHQKSSGTASKSQPVLSFQR